MKCYIDNSVIICDEIIDTPHTVSINSDINKTKKKWIITFCTLFY